MDHLEAWAISVMAQIGFTQEIILDRGYWYTKDKPRSITIRGHYKGTRAVFRGYYDPRPCEEAGNQIFFDSLKRNPELQTPRLLAYKHLSSHRGWYVQEHMPDSATALRPRAYGTPLTDEERQMFLACFLGYRRKFQPSWIPDVSGNPAMLPRSLQVLPPQAAVYHRRRLRKWRLKARLVQFRAPRLEKPWVDPVRVRAAISNGTKATCSVYPGVENKWGHNHATAAQFFRDWRSPVGSGPTYLINFRHVSMRPLGYDIAFAAIWADVLMPMVKHGFPSLGELRRRISTWLVDIARTFEQAGVASPLPDEVANAAILERCLGTLMLDVTASDLHINKKRQAVSVLVPYIEDLTNDIVRQRLVL